MDVRTCEILQFKDILNHLARRAGSALGSEYVRALEPCSNLSEIETRQAPIAEFKKLIEAHGSLAFGGLADLKESFALARREGSLLEPAQMLQIARLLEICAELAAFRDRHGEEFPAIARLLRDFEDHGDLRMSLERTFAEDGSIRDSASPTLSSLRRRKRNAERNLQRTVEKLTSKLASDGVLQDSFATQRNGRNVLPVKSNQRAKIPGILHGSSATGETYYVEPLELIEAGNEVETLSEEEIQEIRRILIALTAEIRPLAGLLEANQDQAAEVDGLQAIAKTAVEFGWNHPVMREGATLRLFKAHHPLLNLENTRASVPITFLLEPDDRCLIFSGPNAGGKTTAMKTVATLSMLAQCGCPIPAFPDSTLPVFRNVLADIGDAQDLQSGLSTFSGHILRIKELWKKTGPDSLVVMDELGTGTDPQEGAALALALLEGFQQRARLTLTTSHLNPVKQWAEQTPGVRNASFSLDPNTRAPTFQLRLDIPGASEALEIAEREGIAKEIIAKAKELVGQKHLQMGEMIRRVEEKEVRLATATREAEARVKALEEQEEVLRARSELLREERRELKERAAREREAAIAEYRDKIEKFIAELPSEEELARRKKALIRAREEALRDEQLSVSERRRLAEEQHQKNEAYSGQRVFVSSLGQWGEVIETDREKGRARVAIGVMQATVKFDDLLDYDPEVRRAEQIARSEELSLPRAARKRKKKSRKVKHGIREAQEYTPPSRGEARAAITSVSRPVSMTLDLHGYRVEEAIAEVDRYLDRSLLADFPYVKICHGTGAGRLYKAVHEYLRQHPAVKKYRFATPDEGGGGVTVVEF